MRPKFKQSPHRLAASVESGAPGQTSKPIDFFNLVDLLSKIFGG
jgi:hypothetical protein